MGWEDIVPITNVLINRFNRGIISPSALARTDVDKIQNAAELQTNWMPRSLGSMGLRPGTRDIVGTRSNLPARYIDFVFAIDDTAMLEMTNNTLRVLVNEQPISRVAVAATIANGTFNSDLTSWTQDDETGAVSAWVTGGYMGLLGTGFNRAIRYQTVTVSNPGIEHGIRMVVTRGPIFVRVGSTVGGEEYITERSIGVGTHSWVFTPSGNFTIQFSNAEPRQMRLDSVSIEGAGAVELPTPWGDAQLPLLRWDQSGDVVFVACFGVQQHKIIRYGTKSWSVVKYEPLDGPFRGLNTSKVRITPSATRGSITLAASDNVFRAGHVGALFRFELNGQRVDAVLGGDEQYSDPIRVSGLDANRGRDFYLTIAGTWSGTLNMQRSVGEPGNWFDIGQDWTANTTDEQIDGDDDDNAIYYYRIGFNAGDWSFGDAEVTLNYPNGTSTGVVRITAVSSPIAATADVLTPLGGITATANWYEGTWSDLRGWPSAVRLAEGRLAWGGKDKIILSASDAFETFGPDIEGDAAPINRSIGSGPVDKISWMLALQRLILGGQAAAWSVRSNSIDEPLTRTNFNIKKASTRGSAPVDAVEIDSGGIFVQRGGTRVMSLDYSFDKGDYSPTEETILCPEICKPGIVSIDVQRLPDTRIHCVLSDGTVAILIYDKAENLTCWIKYETDGLVEDCIVMPSPNEEEDYVYYVVLRNGTNRRLERWAFEEDCVGGSLNLQADAHVVHQGSPTSTISGLSHLNGKTVVVWADGTDRGTRVVTGGSISIGSLASNVVVGLGYRARYRSVKLAYGAQLGTALCQKKRIASLGLILADTHAQGIKFGQSFDVMDQLPLFYKMAPIDPNEIYSSYDQGMESVPGDWDSDARLCLEANAPRPAYVLGMVLGMDMNENGDDLAKNSGGG